MRYVVVSFALIQEGGELLIVTPKHRDFGSNLEIDRDDDLDSLRERRDELLRESELLHTTSLVKGREILDAELLVDDSQRIAAEYRQRIVARVDHALANRAAGVEELRQVVHIATTQLPKDADLARLRSTMREATLDRDKLIDALDRGSYGAFKVELDRGAYKQRDLRREYAEAYRDTFIGRINLDEIGLKPSERAQIEAALGDGRVNPETIERMVFDGETQKVGELAEELEEERRYERERVQATERKMSAF